jgi:hypothetical protein
LIYKEFFAPLCNLCDISKINPKRINELPKTQNVTSRKSMTYPIYAA